MKNKKQLRNSEQSQRDLRSYDPKPIRSLFLTLRLCLYIFNLSFLAVCLITPNGYAETLTEKLETVNDEDSGPVSLPQHNLLISKSPTTHLGRQLWQARISTPKDTQDSQGKIELREIIRRIRSVVFKPKGQTPKPFIVVGSLRKTETGKTLSDTNTPQEQTPKKNERKLSYEQITDQTLQILKNLSQDPDQLHNPFELAEILFNSRCLREAAKCYQEALSRMSKNETNLPRHKDWLLFQIGNCLRNDDPPTAMQMYKQLIAEYPNSPWADLGKARSKLIDWYLKDKPNTLINESKMYLVTKKTEY